jgi:hypothetical protein
MTKKFHFQECLDLAAAHGWTEGYVCMLNQADQLALMQEMYKLLVDRKATYACLDAQTDNIQTLDHTTAIGDMVYGLMFTYGIESKSLEAEV